MMNRDKKLQLLRHRKELLEKYGDDNFGNLVKSLKGLDGTNGNDGEKGKDGRDGIDGKDGRDGTPGLPGIQGKQGSTGTPGEKGVDGQGIVWRGEWSYGTTYKVNDAIAHLGSSFIVTAAHKSSNDTEPLKGSLWLNYWNIMASKGDKGEPGQSGGGGGGAGPSNSGAVWGSITGALSNQADLQTALDTKALKTTTVNGHSLSSNVTVTASDVSLGNVDNTSDATKNAASVTLTNKTISGASNTLSAIANASLTNSTITVGSTSIALGATATTLAGLTLTTPVFNGTPTGTGVAAAATASTLALRDAQSNLIADAFIPGFTTTATAAGTTTLTVDSTEFQQFTGSTTQTVLLPTTGVVAGQRFTIANNSSGSVTVQSSGANTISVVFGGNYVSTFTALVATPTTAAHWTTATTLPATQFLSGAANSNSIALRDSSANLKADAFVPSSTSTATAAGTTTLTVDSTEVQVFTGSTTQTITLPTTSIIAGQRFTILNSSTGALTINASGGTLVTSVPFTGYSAVVTALVATPTLNTDWSYVVGSPATYSSTASASTIALRSAESNLKADAFVPGLATTATAGATTTLTVDSTEVQVFTGSSAQTILLPTTSVLAGQRYTIINNSTGALTIQSSGANTIVAVSSGVRTVVTALQATPTTAAHWAAETTISANITSGAAASTVATRDASASLTANAFIPGFTTTATAAGTTALTVSSTEVQIFTGATTQTVTLPTTNVAAGQRYTIVNQSTGIVTVQSSGANNILQLQASFAATFVALVATPTTAANWTYLFSPNIAADAAATGSAIVQRTGAANINGNAFIPNFRTQATAAGTTTLVVGDGQTQVFTGATTQTVVLPTTSIVIAREFKIINTSLGVLTINASGGALVKTLAANASTTITALVNTPTAATDWYATA